MVGEFPWIGDTLKASGLDRYHSWLEIEPFLTETPQLARVGEGRS